MLTLATPVALVQQATRALCAAWCASRRPLSSSSSSSSSSSGAAGNIIGDPSRKLHFFSEEERQQRRLQRRQRQQQQQQRQGRDEQLDGYRARLLQVAPRMALAYRLLFHASYSGRLRRRYSRRSRRRSTLNAPRGDEAHRRRAHKSSGRASRGSVATAVTTTTTTSSSSKLVILTFSDNSWVHVVLNFAARLESLGVSSREAIHASCTR